jgi:peptidoglycan/xylan/chitin deacetylase (PgdA/CDA1 family)
MKHKLKLILRLWWARFLFYTGAHALVSRLLPARLTILAGHCVSAPSNAFLPGDMKIEARKLGRILDWLGARYDLVSVGEGWRRLQSGDRRSMVSLTMDDGYRDNVEVLLPMLQERGVSATVYLESRPLDERRVNWTHLYFWALGCMEPSELVERYVAQSTDEVAKRRLPEALAAGGAAVYQLKRVLKYEADQADCAATLAAIFAEQGGSEEELCDELYMTWEDARVLRDAGVELGGHTIHHWVVSGLDADGQLAEIEGGRRALERELGSAPESFAYPFGRRWDWNEASCEAVRSAGFTTATTTHAGTNLRGAEPKRLARIMIDEAASLPLIVAEACGGFELLRRFGLDLSE